MTNLGKGFIILTAFPSLAITVTYKLLQYFLFVYLISQFLQFNFDMGSFLQIRSNETGNHFR